MFFGQTRLKGGEEWAHKLSDLNTREQIILFPTLALALLLGIMPSLVFAVLNDSVLNLLNLVTPYL
jgi:NADH-quinone oxidoreductase subunit M